MEILLEDINYITIESQKGYTMQDLFKDVEGITTPVTFAIAEKIEDGVVTMGDYDPQFTLSSFDSKGDGEIRIDCSLYVFNARKYYEGIIDVDVLHTAIRKVATERQLAVTAADDEPAFYNTYVNFSMNTTLDEPVESFLSHLKKEASCIYLNGKRKAIDEQIKTLQEYKETI